MYLHRTLASTLALAARQFPVVVLTGPRQSGKTTLLRHEFGNSIGYVSLDAPEVKAAAIADPRAFLAQHRPPVILDEVQQAPALLSYIRAIIDDDRDRPGQYIVTGSQNIFLLASVTETLAGRAAVLRLMPMTLREAERLPDAPMPWQIDPAGALGRPSRVIASHSDIWRRLLVGFYPAPVTNPDMDRELWHTSYMTTYLERDVRSVRDIGRLASFQTFLSALAARTAQQLNIADVSRDTSIPVSTCRTWLSVLDATHQVILVPPYYRNVGKRLVKAPKLYFMDTGLVCHLCGIYTPEHAAKGPMAGALFETAVVTEAYKAAVHAGRMPRLYYWRTSGGAEVDLVLDENGTSTPIEIKANATPSPSSASGIRRFQGDHGDTARGGWVVHPGETWLPLAQGVTAVPFGAV